MYYANIVVTGQLFRLLCRSWEEGERLATDMGGTLASLTSARISRATQERVVGLLEATVH